MRNDCCELNSQSRISDITINRGGMIMLYL